MHSSTELLRTGGFPPKLSEYVSRDCRLLLVELALEAMRTEHREDLKFKERNGEPYKRGGWNIGPLLLLARRIGVTKRAVQQWVDKVKHPCNENIDKIVEIVINFDQDKLVQILEEDLFAHQYSLGLLQDQISGYAYPFARNRGVPTKQGVVV